MIRYRKCGKQSTINISFSQLVTLGGNEDNAIHLGKFDRQDQKYGLQGFGHLLD